MTTDLLTGELVQLIVPDLKTDPQRLANWSRDSEFMRLYDTDPARVLSSQMTREEMEKGVVKNVWFMIQTLDTRQVIGEVSLAEIDYRIGNAWLGIGIGDRDCWGKGYGSEATCLIAGFAFSELNLRRISLNVLEYNERAINAYQKCGFLAEGRSRKWVLRCGQRWDVIYMGLLREEWEARELFC